MLMFKPSKIITNYIQVEKVAYSSIMLHLKERELLRTVEVDSGGLFVI